MKKLLSIQIIISFLFVIFFSATINAGEYYGKRKTEVTITNMTRGQIFSPPVLIIHNKHFNLFEPGMPSTEGLSLMAEDGDTSALISEISELDSVAGYVTAKGPVLPGQKVVLEFETKHDARFITLAGMLVTTNDAFWAKKNINVFYVFGKKTLNAQAYDAGTEVNNEDCGFIPGPPCGNPLQRAAEGAEGYVHVHAGIHGEGDLSVMERDWRNPVAQIIIKRVY